LSNPDAQPYSSKTEGKSHAWVVEFHAGSAGWVEGGQNDGALIDGAPPARDRGESRWLRP
jgi:hypothetical protein